MSEESVTSTPAPATACCCNHTPGAQPPVNRKSLWAGVAIGALAVFVLGGLHQGHREGHDRHHEDRHHRRMYMEHMGHMEHMDHMKHMEQMWQAHELAPRADRMGEMMGEMSGHTSNQMDEMLGQMSDSQRQADDSAQSQDLLPSEG